MLSDNKHVIFACLPKSPPDAPTTEESLSLREISWFSSESLAPQALAFNPLGDYCLLVTHNLELYAVCVERILPSSTGTVG